MRIKELREQRNILQKELGMALDIAPNTLSQYETGKREPDLETTQRIADFFGVSVDDLLGREDIKKAPTTEGGRNLTDSELMFGLWGDSDDVGEEDLADVKRYAQFVRERKKEQRK